MTICTFWWLPSLSVSFWSQMKVQIEFFENFHCWQFADQKNPKFVPYCWFGRKIRFYSYYSLFWPEQLFSIDNFKIKTLQALNFFLLFNQKMFNIAQNKFFHQFFPKWTKSPSMCDVTSSSSLLFKLHIAFDILLLLSNNFNWINMIWK